MTIISHKTIADNHAQVDGMRYVRHSFTNHIGEVIQSPIFKVPASWAETEYLAIRTAMIPSVELHQEEGEEVSALSIVESGDDVLALTLDPKYSTSKKIAKKLIRYMMREHDPRIVIALEPLIVYLRANYTNAQLKTFLDLTTLQAQKMNQRINAVLDNKATVFDAFDSAYEDIE